MVHQIYDADNSFQQLVDIARLGRVALQRPKWTRLVIVIEIFSENTV